MSHSHYKYGVVISMLVLVMQMLQAQTVEITKKFFEVENSSVIAAYSNEFASEIKEYGDAETGDFKFVVIRVNLEGDVAEAKNGVTLNCPTQRLKKTYKEKSNQMLFLFPYEAKTIFVDCGDGCERKLLVEGRELESNTIYETTVKYTLPKSADASKQIKVAIIYNNTDEQVAYREHSENEKVVDYKDIPRSADSLSLTLGKLYDFSFSRNGYKPIYKTYKIESNNDIGVPQFDEQRTGVVMVSSKPKGAKIFYKIKDSKYSPETDNGLTPHKLELPIGDYELYVQHKNYYTSESQIVSVKEDNSKNLIFKLKERVYFRTFLLLAGAYSPSNQWSGGVMVGMVKHAGWYVKCRSSFTFTHFNKYDAVCDKDGYIDGEMIYYSGKTSKPYVIATGGLTVRLGCPLTMYVGAGYGFRQTLWETTTGKWIKNNDYSFQGVAADVGLLYNTRSHVSVMAGVSTIGFKYVEFEIGLGYAF